MTVKNTLPGVGIEVAPRTGPWRMLDFGSGSGILAIGAARLGAVVDAVENGDWRALAWRDRR